MPVTGTAITTGELLARLQDVMSQLASIIADVVATHQLPYTGSPQKPDACEVSKREDTC